MNLQDLINQIEHILRGIHNPKDVEIHMDVELLDEIHYHLKTYSRTAGNPGRPDPRNDPFKPGREWKNPLGDGETAQERNRRRAEDETLKEWQRAEEESRKAKAEYARRAEEEVFRKFQQHWEKTFYGRRSAWEDVFNRAGFSQANPSAYDILGVKPGSSKAEITKAYRRLAMKHHPDRPGGNKEKFQEIKRAKEQLVGK